MVILFLAPTECVYKILYRLVHVSVHQFGEVAHSYIFRYIGRRGNVRDSCEVMCIRETVYSVQWPRRNILHSFARRNYPSYKYFIFYDAAGKPVKSVGPAADTDLGTPDPKCLLRGPGRTFQR